MGSRGRGFALRGETTTVRAQRSESGYHGRRVQRAKKCSTGAREGIDVLATQGQARGDALEANAEDMPPPPPAPKMVWGKPTRCPECGGPGFLEHIDLRKGVMYQHGRECDHKWEISEAEILASQDV